MRSKLSLVLAAGTLLVAACGSAEEGASTETEGADAPTATIEADVSTTIAVPTTVVFDDEVTAVADESSTTSSTLGGTTTSAGGAGTSAPPSSVAAAACSAGPPPAPDVDTPHVQIDVNGDGTMETAYAAFYSPVWMIIVEFADGEYASEAIVDAEEFDAVRVLGGTRFIGDKTDDVTFTVGGGAYTTAVGFMRADGCGLNRLNWESGLAASFLSGASVSNYSGLVCRNGGVDQYFFSISGEDDAGNPLYEGGFTPYNLEGTTFVEFPGDGTVLTLDELADLETFDCFDMTL